MESRIGFWCGNLKERATLESKGSDEDDNTGLL
jgi:hypothetical protein